MGLFDSKLCLISQNTPNIDFLSISKCFFYYRNTPVIQQSIEIICNNTNIISSEKYLSHKQMKLLITNLLICGSVYVFSHRNKIFILNPMEIQQQGENIYIPDLGTIKKYIYLHLLVTKTSPLEPIQSSIEICNLIKDHYIGLLQNGARPSGILTHENIMSNSKRDVVSKELKNLYKNMEKGSIAVLEGNYKWNSIGICPEKLDLLNSYNYFSKEISMSLGVPPIILGLSDPTFSNYKEAKIFLIENTCKPLLSTIESFFYENWRE